MGRKEIAIVLGGVTNHIILINKLKERGFYTVLIDYLEDPPAKIAADEHIQVSTFDLNAIEKIAVDRKVSLIINCCLEHLNKGICKICEKIGLPKPYSYETAMDISDKERMKTKMREGGISTTPFICVSSSDELDGVDLNFPLYVKPATGSGSNAVNRAVDVETTKEAVQKSLTRYPNSKVIIEEEAMGDEYSVYCFPSDGSANVLLVVRRYTDNNSAKHVTKCVATLGPALISQEAYKNVVTTADRIAEVFKLTNTPMFMQVMIYNNTVNVIEFAGRMAGGFSYRTIYLSTGFDLFEATINSFLQISNHVEYHKPDQYITVSTVYASPCIFNEVLGYKELFKDGTISDVILPRFSGTKINDSSANGSRVAFLIHRDKTVKGVLDKIKKTFESIDVIDTDGCSRMKRDIYLTKKKL